MARLLFAGVNGVVAVVAVFSIWRAGRLRATARDIKMESERRRTAGLWNMIRAVGGGNVERVLGVEGMLFL